MNAESISKSEKEEAVLLQRIGQKDAAALAELYDRFSKILFSVATHILHDNGQAEEVLQEVFLQIWERASTFDPRYGKPITWAVVMTRNKAIDALRRRQRQSLLLEKFQMEEIIHTEIRENQASERLTGGDWSGVIATALRELNKEQRCAIEMAFFEGLTQTEIACRLGEPLGTVKARIRRGMLQLRSFLEGQNLNGIGGRSDT